MNKIIFTPQRTRIIPLAMYPCRQPNQHTSVGGCCYGICPTSSQHLTDFWDLSWKKEKKGGTRWKMHTQVSGKIWPSPACRMNSYLNSCLFFVFVFVFSVRVERDLSLTFHYRWTVDGLDAIYFHLGMEIAKVKEVRCLEHTFMCLETTQIMSKWRFCPISQS